MDNIFPKELFFPQRTIFKKGASLDLASECLQFGSRGLIVHGCSFEKNSTSKLIFCRFSDYSKVESFCREKQDEPDLDEIVEVIEMAKSVKAQWVCGIGGGSVLDLAKASAGLFNAKNSPLYYQEGGKLRDLGIPFIAVPTTAGSGSEATVNSVIINKKKKVKLSIRDNSFLARTVILDIELLKSLSALKLSYSAMDALVHAYESYISKNSTWFSEVLALKAISLLDKNIIAAFESKSDEHLSALLLASYLAGLALSSARLGVIHGIAHPLGALYGLPHGLICSVCLVPSIKINKKLLGRKYAVMTDITGQDFLERVKNIINFLDIRSPFKNKKIIDKEKIIRDTLNSGSTAANPKKINRKDIELILKEIFYEN